METHNLFRQMHSIMCLNIYVLIFIEAHKLRHIISVHKTQYSTSRGVTPRLLHVPVLNHSGGFPKYQMLLTCREIGFPLNAQNVENKCREICAGPSSGKLHMY